MAPHRGKTAVTAMGKALASSTPVGRTTSRIMATATARVGIHTAIPIRTSAPGLRYL